MRWQRVLVISNLGVLIFSLSASCAKETTPEQTNQVLSVTSTRVPAKTPVPSPTPTIVPSPTPQPTLTATPAPSPTLEMTADDYFDQGVTLFEQGDFEMAMVALDQAIALDPWFLDTAYAYRHAARAKWETNLPLLYELDSEITELDQVIIENPEDAEAYYERGRVKYLRTILSGEPVDKEPLFQDNDNINVVGGTITADTLNLEHAITDFNQAITIDPEFAAAYHMRGLAYHVQGLEYIGIALVGFNPEAIENAIDNYDLAISLDPEMTDAYHDRGTARAQRSYLIHGKADEIPETAAQDMEEAISDLTAAIELDPRAEASYLNRAFVYMLFSVWYSEDAGLNPLEGILQSIDDSGEVIEQNPDNMWGYLIRGVAATVYVEEGTGDEIVVDQLDRQGERDNEIYSELGENVLRLFEFTDLFTRILTLSLGPPIDPTTADLQLLGYIENGVYTSPDGSFRLVVPELMQPNTEIWDELATSGDLLVRFGDDLGRWYSMGVHPGILGDMPLADRVRLDISQYMNVQYEDEIDTPYGSSVIFVYRNENQEVTCASGILHHVDHFYAAEYCLMDHYMGEYDGSGGVRVFAEGYGIKYEPVDVILVNFMQGLVIPGESN